MTAVGASGAGIHLAVMIVIEYPNEGSPEMGSTPYRCCLLGGEVSGEPGIWSPELLLH